ncbi:hypothetical protein KJ359_007614 [Pestalotiopsis sp. 9143b]|nr:hypothetical protein KJ359_007614 [Pestalotiopsis sp. 9143b]
MPDVMELRWNDGPKRAKASKIPDHVWVRYKEEIRELYGSMTVEELAASIKRTHGFEATLRQYTARLDLWGFKKYKTKKTSQGTQTVSPGNPEIAVNGEFGQQISEAVRTDDFKRRMSTSSCETERQTSGISKRLKIDHQQNIPYRTPSPTSSENSSTITIDSNSAEPGNAAASSDSIDVTRADTTLHPPSSNHPLGEQSRVLSEDIVASILIEQPTSTIQSFALGMNLEFCSTVATKVGSFSLPRYGPMLSFEVESRLKLVAEYLSASKKLEEAASLYSIIFVSEVLRGAFRDELYTPPSLISCARSARSQVHCSFIQRILSEVVSRLRYRVTRSSAEQFLAHAFLANLFSRQGKVSESGHHLGEARSFSKKLVENGDILRSYLPDMLVYVYYKRFCHLDHGSTSGRRTPPVTTVTEFQGPPPISHIDFVNFWSAMRRGGPARREPGANPVSRYLEESLDWCQKATIWHESSDLQSLQESLSEKVVRSNDESDVFIGLWQMWHGAYTSAPKPSEWLVQAQEHLGVSLAEHLNICAEVIDITCSKERSSLFEDDGVLTIYLQRLYERTEMPREPATCIWEPRGLYERTKKPRESLSVAIRRLCDREDTQQEASSLGAEKVQPALERPSGISHQKVLSLTPTLAPSLRSADSSYRRFKASAAVKRQPRGTSYGLSTSTLPSPDQVCSSYESNGPMSQLSDFFERSCGVGRTCASRTSRSKDSFPEYRETSFAGANTKADVVEPGFPASIHFNTPLW